MSTPSISGFAGTAALYAVLREDDAEARRIVADMLPGERAEFAGQLDRLRAMLTDRFGNDIGTRFPAPTHPYAGHDKARAEIGLPGHCEDCADRGHVAAHPDLGCGDVGCTKGHGDRPLCHCGQRLDPGAGALHILCYAGMG